MIRTFLEAVKARRSLYGISAQSTLSDGALAELVEDCLTHVPSAFNSQSARAVLLLGDAHSKLWNGIVLPTLRARVPAEKFASTENKIASVAAGYGTILYFDDTAVTGALAERFPTDAQNFPLLKHTQHTRLYGPTDLADFVEKDSAVVGHFEQAGLAAFACAGERAALVTEQFAFKQTLG